VTGRAALAGIVLVLLAGALAPVTGAEPTPPLSDEDVVRMLAAGRSDAEIVREIGSRDVRFDLSEEMAAELRAAGVSERVLAAMQARQTALHPPEPPPKPAPSVPESLPTALVTFRSAHEGDTALYLPAVLPSSVARALQLPAAPRERAITAVALFVACTTADHVPDQWRTRSPLGRDFVSMPRHEMLALHASTTRVTAKDVPRSMRGGTQDTEPGKEAEWLRLDLPAELSIPLRPEVVHDLVAGLAVLAGENYLALALSDRKELALESLAGGLRVSVDPGGATRPPQVKLLPLDDAQGRR
jgi:hypothetical protein